MSSGVEARLKYFSRSRMEIPFTDFVIWRTNGPFIDVGLNFKDNQALLSNKIGFEYYYLVLAARANLVNTTDFNYNQICFRPEVGLTLFT